MSDIIINKIQVLSLFHLYKKYCTGILWRRANLCLQTNLTSSHTVNCFLYLYQHVLEGHTQRFWNITTPCSVSIYLISCRKQFIQSICSNKCSVCFQMLECVRMPESCSSLHSPTKHWTRLGKESVLLHK